MGRSDTTGPRAPPGSPAEWAERGFKGVKAKIGYPTVQEDVAVIRAIRKAVGDGVAIMVDYNQCLTPVEAVERLRVLDGEGLTWVEEPTLAHDYAGHALIAREAKTPIQCGENWWGTLDLRHALEAAGLGLHHARRDEDRRRDRLAPRGGARPGGGRPRLQPPLARDQRELLCVTPTAHWLEYADWWNPILTDPLEIQGRHGRRRWRDRDRRRLGREGRRALFRVAECRREAAGC